MSKVFDFTPFSSIENFLKAVCIISKLYCKNKNNVQQVHDCVSNLVQQTSQLDFDKFLSLTLNYPKKYPLEFVQSLAEFEISIINYSNQMNKQSITISSPANKCFFCLDVKNDDWFIYNNSPFGKDPILYGDTAVEKVRMNLKQCKKCSNLHYISYAVNSQVNPPTKHFFENATSFKYFHYSNETLYETEVIHRLLTDIMFKQSPFRSFANGYNNDQKRRGNNIAERDKLQAKRITEVFYCFEINKFYKEHCFGVTPTFKCLTSNSSDIDPVNQILRELKPKLGPCFIKKWSQHEKHKVNGKEVECNFGMVGDATWKIARFKCIYDDDDCETNINSPEFGKIVSGCRLSPNRGTYYCKSHDGYEIKFNVNGKKVSWNPNMIYRMKLVPHEVVNQIHDSYIDPFDKEFYLVTSNKEELKWVVKEQIRPELFFGWLANKHATRVSNNNNNNNNTEKTCNTDKTAVTSCDIKCKTRGIVILVSTCGIVLSFREIFGSESLPQVAFLMMDTLDLMKGKKPEYIIYDDACHLRRFIENDYPT